VATYRDTDVSTSAADSDRPDLVIEPLDVLAVRRGE